MVRSDDHLVEIALDEVEHSRGVSVHQTLQDRTEGVEHQISLVGLRIVEKSLPDETHHNTLDSEGSRTHAGGLDDHPQEIDQVDLACLPDHEVFDLGRVACSVRLSQAELRRSVRSRVDQQLDEQVHDLSFYRRGILVLAHCLQQDLDAPVLQ